VAQNQETFGSRQVGVQKEEQGSKQVGKTSQEEKCRALKGVLTPVDDKTSKQPTKK
jgi:hypothetical protein